MNAILTEQQALVRTNVARLCARFGDEYWLARDADGEYGLGWDRIGGFLLPARRGGQAGAAMKVLALRSRRPLTLSGKSPSWSRFPSSSYGMGMSPPLRSRLG